MTEIIIIERVCVFKRETSVTRFLSIHVFVFLSYIIIGLFSQSRRKIYLQKRLDLRGVCVLCKRRFLVKNHSKTRKNLRKCHFCCVSQCSTQIARKTSRHINAAGIQWTLAIDPPSGLKERKILENRSISEASSTPRDY